MEYETIFNILKTLEIPVAYDHFNSDKNVNPPFLTYREISSDTFKADNISYLRKYNYELELVTIKKDAVLQNRLEEILTNNKIPYDKEDEVWDHDEKIYHNYYEI